MNAETKPAKHSAPGQYLGFALQPVRVFYHLLTSPKGAKVSLEFKDDVAVHYADGALLLEQTKSALKQNPVSDWAEDLWKAFENWRAMIVAEEIDPTKTSYRLFVTPQKKGAFVEGMGDAQDADAAAEILKTIRAKVAKLKAVPGCSVHLQPFLDAPAEQQVAIISRFAFESDGSDPLDAIRAVLTATIAENQRDVLIKSGIGQAKQALDRLIQRGEPAILDAEAFRQEFHAFVRQNNMPGLLTSFGDAPDDALVAGVASTRPTFIRQLELVDATYDDRLRAVSDYLRTSADKADWADRGIIFRGSLDTWDDDLVRRYGMIRGDVSDLHAEKPMLLHRPTYEAVASTRKASGLPLFAAKFDKEREALMELHGRALQLRPLSLQSIGVAATSRLLKIDHEAATLHGYPLDLLDVKKPSIPERLKGFSGAADKIGYWFSKLGMPQIASTLRIDF